MGHPRPTLSVILQEEGLAGGGAIYLNDSKVGADLEAADEEVGVADVDASAFLSLEGAVVDERQRVVPGPSDAA